VKPREVHYYSAESSRPIAVSTRHTSLASYKKAVGAFRRSLKDMAEKRNMTLVQGINESTPYMGARFEEYEFMQDGQRHMKLVGRELLGSIQAFATIAEIYGVGARLLVCPLAPDFVGGRLGRAAQEFEQHKALALRVWYEPVVPTTTSGALGMYFFNDVGVEAIEVGLNELAHAATHKSFVQTPVWQSICMDIQPEDAINRYFDEESSDFRFEVQGILSVESASNITLDPTGATGPINLGNIYLEYEFDFFSEVLDYSVPMKNFTRMSVLTDVTVGARVVGANVSFRIAATTAAGTPAITNISQFPQGVAANADLIGYIFVGRAMVTPGCWGDGTNQMNYTTTDDPTARRWWGGQAVFLRFFNAGGIVVASVWADLASAGSADASWLDGQNSGLQFVADATALTPSTMQLHGFWVELN
jgi:hypothetical protein